MRDLRRIIPTGQAKNDFDSKIFDHITDCAKETGGDICKTNDLLKQKCNAYIKDPASIGKLEGESLISASAYFGRYCHAPIYDSIEKIIEEIKNMKIISHAI